LELSPVRTRRWGKVECRLLAVLVFAVLLVGYWAWPFVELRALAAALQAHNATALSKQVDFARLRNSLAQQIIAAYLRVTGRESKLGD
jgi:Protein of unknown function (DUF2939)